MNFVFFSPNFPPGYYRFGQALRDLGANVLGLGDCAYDDLTHFQKAALNEYYRVDDLNNYDQVLRGLGYFTHHYGKIDQIESFNEYWLAQEARLRTDFNIAGLKFAELQRLQQKSYMKKLFQDAGVEAVPGEIYQNFDQAEAFIQKTGYPIISKPDVGVGAQQTFRINNRNDLLKFTEQAHPGDYFLEAFVKGSLESFDGLTDLDGNIVFYTSHIFSQGIMETVNQDLDLYYYSRRDIPDDLSSAGKKIIRAINLKGRFFHIEFFRTDDNRLVALEINLRPPGGLTVDMFNYANDFDVYYQWALLSMKLQFDLKNKAKYYVCYAGRKNNHTYHLTHEQILDLTKDVLVQHESISQAMRSAIGDYGYVIRDQNLENLIKTAKLIQQKAQAFYL